MWLVVLSSAAWAAPPPETACQAGDTEACLAVAESAFTAKQKDVALLTAQGLCEKGEGEGCMRLAQYMEKLNVSVRAGKTPAQLRERGMKLLEASCTANSGPACFRFGKALYHGKGIVADPKRGAELLEKSCTAKFAAACVFLASLDRDGEKGRAYLERACDAGDGPGCTGLGDRDKKRSLELYGKACTAQDAAGCSKQGALQRTARKLDKAVASFEQSCDLGLDEACVDAGALRESGKGVVDLAKAREHYARACDEKVGAGCLGLALLVATNRGGARDWGKAVELAQSACAMDAKGACDAAKKLAARPPDGTCSTKEQCTPLCDEKIPKACVALGDLIAKPNLPEACEAAESFFTDKCNAGVGGAVCLRAGNVTPFIGYAGRAYERGCERGDKQACVLSAYIGAAQNEPGDYDKLAAACTKRQPDACYWLARVMPEDRVVEAERQLRAVCTRGDGRACELLAESLEFGGRRSAGATCCDGPVDDGRTPAERKRDAARAAEAVTAKAKACKLGRVRACGSDEQKPRTCRATELTWDQ